MRNRHSKRGLRRKRNDESWLRMRREPFKKKRWREDEERMSSLRR